MVDARKTTYVVRLLVQRPASACLVRIYGSLTPDAGPMRPLGLSSPSSQKKEERNSACMSIQPPVPQGNMAEKEPTWEFFRVIERLQAKRQVLKVPFRFIYSQVLGRDRSASNVPKCPKDGKSGIYCSSFKHLVTSTRHVHRLHILRALSTTPDSPETQTGILTNIDTAEGSIGGLTGTPDGKGELA